MKTKFELLLDHVEEMSECHLDEVGASGYGFEFLKEEIEYLRNYYKQQIAGLILLLKDSAKQDDLISREYIIEKLSMIETGGINFHPCIKKAVGIKTNTILDEN